MARIRNLKPGFFKNAELFDAEKASGFPLRLAYEGLWCIADREGRFKWKPREIKTDVLPYDDLDMADVMEALVKYRFIFKYKANGFEYGFIPTFKEHQFINKNEAPSTIPAPPENSNDYSEIVTHHEYTGTLDTDILDTDTCAPAGAPKSRKAPSEPLPDWVPAEPWAAFVEMRVKLRAPLTPRAVKLTIGALAKLRDDGFDPKAVLEQSTMRAWRGLFPVGSDGKTQAKARASPAEPYTDPAEEYRRNLAEAPR